MSLKVVENNIKRKYRTTSQCTGTLPTLVPRSGCFGGLCSLYSLYSSNLPLTTATNLSISSSLMPKEIKFLAQLIIEVPKGFKIDHGIG